MSSMDSNSHILQSLSAYLRAWARHEVFITLASRDAWVRSGLVAAADLFGATIAELPSSGVLHYTPHTGIDAVDVIVEDDALIYRFSHEHPDRARRGERNDRFLCPERFVDRLTSALERPGEAVRMVVLRPAPLYETEEIAFADFLSRLDRFLSLLLPSYRYALEPAGRICLRREYFECLHDRRVAHVFSEGERIFRALPSVSDQLTLSGAFDHPFCVVRTTLDAIVPGIPWPVPDGALRRQGWCDAVRRCLANHIPLYLFVDDETDPLRALMTFMKMMNNDLAQRSVIRCSAA